MIEGRIYCCDAPRAVRVETPTGTVIQCGSCGAEEEEPTDPIELAFWECGHVEVDTGETHVCPLDACSPTYKPYSAHSNATSAAARACLWCNGSLEHRNAKAVWCSEPCRLEAFRWKTAQKGTSTLHGRIPSRRRSCTLGRPLARTGDAWSVR